MPCAKAFEQYGGKEGKYVLILFLNNKVYMSNV